MSRAFTTYAKPQGANEMTPVRLHAPPVQDAVVRSAAPGAWALRDGASGDPLGDFLARLHLPGWRCETTTLSSTTPVVIDAGLPAVYLVLNGAVRVELSGDSRQPANQRGELALVSAAASLRVAPDASDLNHPNVVTTAALLIARFSANSGGHPLAGLLPRYISSAECNASGPLSCPSFLDWIACQAVSNAPGSGAIASRFLQSLLIDLLRSQLHSSDSLHAAQAPASTGAYQATFDACLGAVMRMVHAAPHRDWTVHSMARESGLSRSAFADRFRTVVGQPPLQYVTEIRMQKAAELLELTDIPVKRIAAQVGYESVSAFSSAFKRRFSVPPIAVRQATARTDDSTAS